MHAPMSQTAGVAPVQQTPPSGTQHAPGRESLLGRTSGKEAKLRGTPLVLLGAGRRTDDSDHASATTDTVDGVTSAGGSPAGSESSSSAVAGARMSATGIEIASNASTPTSTGVQPETEPRGDVRENLPRAAKGRSVIRLADKLPFASVFNRRSQLSTVPVLEKLKDQIARPPPGLETRLNTRAKPFVPRCDHSPTAFPCSSYMASVPPPR